MTTLERRRRILNFVQQRKTVSIHDLQAHVSTSPATLRRDLAFLESERRLVRTHGGAALPEFLVGEPSFTLRQQADASAKQAIGATAATIKGLKGSVFIDAGTTCLELAKPLLQRSEIKLFTNSLPLLNLASQIPCEIVSLGGSLRRVSYALVGSLALDWLDHLRFDWAFVGASGLDASEGAFTTEPLEAALKAKVLQRARNKVLLADSSKWNHPTAVRFASWDAFTHWVVERPIAFKSKPAGMQLLATSKIQIKDAV